MFETNSLKVGIAFAGVALLSACTVTPVKDVTADPVAYLGKNFSSETLPASVAKKIPDDGKSVRFGRLVIALESTSEDSTGKKDSWKTTMTLIDAGNGLVQRMTELSNNDIAYGLNYSLSHRNIFDLKWQRVPLKGNVTDPLYEVKEITQLDAFPLEVGKKFSFFYAAAPSFQIANFQTFQKSCEIKRTVPASNFNKKLTGQATEFECEFRTNNVVSSRSKWVMLEKFGIGLQLGYTHSNSKTSATIVDVSN